MKKMCIFILIINLILAMLLPNFSYAYSPGASGGGSSGGTSDLGLGDLSNYRGTNPGSSNLEEKASKILGAIQTIGTVLSVVMLIAIGIKYMLGSVEEKAEYKKTLWPYIVGAFVLFTGTLLPQLIYDFMKNF